jgi:hypothetical protein
MKITRIDDLIMQIEIKQKNQNVIRCVRYHEQIIYSKDVLNKINV